MVEILKDRVKDIHNIFTTIYFNNYHLFNQYECRWLINNKIKLKNLIRILHIRYISLKNNILNNLIKTGKII